MDRGAKHSLINVNPLYIFFFLLHDHSQVRHRYTQNRLAPNITVAIRALKIILQVNLMPVVIAMSHKLRYVIYVNYEHQPRFINLL